MRKSKFFCVCFIFILAMSTGNSFSFFMTNGHTSSFSANKNKTESFDFENRIIKQTKMNTSILVPTFSIQDLVPRESIVVLNDTAFLSYGFPGNGSKINPYLIENFCGDDDYFGIHIEDTTKYFIIRNCFVNASDGIFIENVANGTAVIIDSFSSSSSTGVIVLSSNNVLINNVTCLSRSLYEGFGYYIQNCYNTTFVNCTSTNNWVGFGIDFSLNTNLFNNNCSNARFGIYSDYSKNSSFENNILYNCGLILYEVNVVNYLSYNVENNFVNNKPLGFITNQDNLVLNESIYGQLYLINCSNVLISNQNLSNNSIGLFSYYCNNTKISSSTFSSTSSYGVFVENSTHCSILDNYFDDANFGIYVVDSHEVTIKNNTLINNLNFGIYIRSSGEITVTDNLCNWNPGVGIYIADNIGPVYLINNTCSNNGGSGIFLSNTQFSYFTNNTCNFNSNFGITLRSHTDNCTFSNNTCNSNNYGIQLSFSDNNLFQNNTCNENQIGILFYAISNSNSIINNTFEKNQGYGVKIRALGGCSFNIIHQNNFLNNNLSATSQGYDDGTNNLWYDLVAREGNYWNDYSGAGFYAIDGSAGSKDQFPFGKIGISTTQLLSVILFPFVFFISLIINLKAKIKKKVVT